MMGLKRKKHMVMAVFLMLIFGEAVIAQNDNGHTYNKQFVVGNIPGIDNFMHLTQREKQIDSLLSQIDEETDSVMQEETESGTGMYKQRDFKKNRSRLFFKVYRNGNLQLRDSLLENGFPTACTCFTDHDTVFVRMNLGFFGGLGFNIDITEHNFTSGCHIYTDDNASFKASPEDTVFQNHIRCESKFQHLVLNNKPEFKPGQHLTGFLKITTKEFYEKKYQQSLDSVYISGRIYFTCRVKTKNPWDK